MSVSRALAVLAAFLFCEWPLCSQTLLFRDYSTQDGLPDSRIAPLLQDHRGYLWFGAQAGLTRYDGAEFKTFGPARDIPGIFGRSIVEDHHGAIWFAFTGFRQGGVLRYRGDSVWTLSHDNGLIGQQPFDVAADSHDDIWVATEKGLERVHFLDSTRLRFTVDCISDTGVMAIHESRDGTLYCADGRGLVEVSAGKLIPVYMLPRQDPDWHVRPYSFFESTAGDLWFGGFNEAYLLSRGIVKRFGRANGVPERGVWCFHEDVDGTLYAGTMEGLYTVARSGDNLLFTKVESFGNAIVYDMCLDVEGNLWFASSPGLRRLLRICTTVRFDHQEDLAATGIGPVKFSPDGTLFLGSRNSGIYTLERERLAQIVPPAPWSGRTVSALLPLPDGELWAGLWRGGVLNWRGGHATMLTPRNNLPSENVHALLKAQHVVVGTSEGLAWIGENGDVHRVPGETAQTSIFHLLETGGDTLWAGTSNGVALFLENSDTLVMIPTPAKLRTLNGVNVYVVFEDREHRIWLGTDGQGAYCVDGDSLRHYTPDDGLLGERIFAIAEDSLRHLWFGSSTGLSCFDGKSFRTLGYAEGFGEIGMHGIDVDVDGTLWVSAYPGVLHLKPVRFYQSNAPPPLYLTEMLVDGKAIPFSDTPTLQPESAVISFHFAALSFTEERNVRYRYRLEGFDHEWSSPTVSREVRYTHLPPGSYTFRVIGRTGDGVWNDVPAQVSFVILHPVWQRWWFIVLTLVCIAAAAYSLYRYRLNRLLELEKTRSRIAMDLHDDIGSTLTRISVMTEVAKRQAEGNTVVGEYLGRIGEASRDLIESLGDIVWSVDPRHDALQDVIRRIVDFGQEVCEGRGMSFETELDGSFEGAKLTLDQRRDIYLVFKEGINNVVKHANATHARLRVRPTTRGALIELLDDGVGLPAEPDASRHGLLSLKERGRRAGIAFSIESEVGVGTKISLEVKTA